MPHLAAVFTKPDRSYNVHLIREFTPEQIAEFEAVLAEFTTLRQRFSLLSILELNFSALDSFINEVKSSSRLDKRRVWLEANRHFMNYLSSGYALREHLKTSLKRDFGRESEQLSRFLKFIDLLEKRCFEYAFFQDFRNFVQHCGFPVGKMNVTHDKDGRVLTLKYPKAVLLKDYSRWGTSNLRERKEAEFDLIALVRGHHRVVTQEFSVVIEAEYGKTLDQIESYFLGLHREAKSVQESAEAKMVLSLAPDPSQGTVELQDIPKNPLAELGLSRKKIKGDIVLFSYQTEEHDRYFEVRKNDIMGFHPTMANLDHDPFPNAKNDDIVRTTFMGRESVLYAKLKAPVDAIRLGVALEVDGHKFALTQVNEYSEPDGDQAIFDVEGSEWLTYIEPLRILAEIRNELAKGDAQA